MANVTPTTLGQIPGSTSPDGASLATWANMLNGDVGVAVSFPTHADRSVQVAGTLGAGGTIVIEGSNDGVNYVTLSDPQGVALSVTAAKIKAISEHTVWIRPRVTGGDGTTSLTVSLLVRRQP